MTQLDNARQRSNLHQSLGVRALGRSVAAPRVSALVHPVTDREGGDGENFEGARPYGSGRGSNSTGVGRSSTSSGMGRPDQYQHSHRAFLSSQGSLGVDEGVGVGQEEDGFSGGGGGDDDGDRRRESSLVGPAAAALAAAADEDMSVGPRASIDTEGELDAAAEEGWVGRGGGTGDGGEGGAPQRFFRQDRYDSLHGGVNDMLASPANSPCGSIASSFFSISSPRRVGQLFDSDGRPVFGEGFVGGGDGGAGARRCRSRRATMGTLASIGGSNRSVRERAEGEEGVWHGGEDRGGVGGGMGPGIGVGVGAGGGFVSTSDGGETGLESDSVEAAELMAAVTAPSPKADRGRSRRAKVRSTGFYLQGTGVGGGSTA